MKDINNAFSLIVCIIMMSLMGCDNTRKNNEFSRQNEISGRLDSVVFDTLLNKKPVQLYFLNNEKQMQAAVTNYGGRLIGLLVPDKAGELMDVVVGYDNIRDLTTKGEGFYGAIIGRYGNRIAKGSFTIDGIDYQSSQNNGINTLHGGDQGFHKQVWQGRKLNNHTLELTYHSEHMEEGFPGNLNVTVVYELTEDNELKISYSATTDRKTIVNLTNHTYFNLNGKGSILDHGLKITADQYIPVNSDLIPSGEVASVKGTPFDFTHVKTIGQDINISNSQLKRGKGYDHNFVLRANYNTEMNHAATVYGNKSGIMMEIYTHEPGIQFYSGNFMKGRNILKNNLNDDYRTAFCLEPQHFPDSPNQPTFPSTVLNVGEVYRTTTLYRFSIAQD